MLPPQNWGCLPKDITASRGDIVQRQFLVLCVGLQQINWRDLASHDQSVGDDLVGSIKMKKLVQQRQLSKPTFQQNFNMSKVIYI